jgi:chromosomal replication initiator protein
MVLWTSRDVGTEAEGRRPVNEAERLWTTCTEALRGSVAESTWRSCFASATPLDLQGERLVVAVPNTIVRERICSRFAPDLDRALSEEGGKPMAIELVVVPDAEVADDALLDLTGPEPNLVLEATPHLPPEPPPGPDSERARFLREAPAAGRYTFEAFVTGDSNRFAHAAAMAVAEKPADAYNPLFIYGVAGLGKTHLLHAIGDLVTRIYPSSRVRYISLEQFMNEFVDSIRSNSGIDFKRRYRNNDVLLVDDIQFMEGKERLQEEFFHTFNECYASGAQVVLSSDRPPRAIATLEERLRSRFEGGLITDIQPPDLETRLAILRKKAEPLSAEIPPDVLELIATAITNNIRELEGALTRVSAFASLNRAPLTEEMARVVLSDVLSRAQPRPITAKRIIEATSRFYGYAVEEICGHSRVKPLVTARQVGMYVCRQLTELSYPAIAREYGNRDHTTVMHAVEKIEALLQTDRQIYDEVSELTKLVRADA